MSKCSAAAKPCVCDPGEISVEASGLGMVLLRFGATEIRVSETLAEALAHSLMDMIHDIRS